MDLMSKNISSSIDRRRPSFILLLTALLLAFTSFTSVVRVSASPVVDASTPPADRCIDFELNKVDALTTLANGSIFLVHSQQYWVLGAREVPSLATGRPISKLIGGVGSSGAAGSRDSPSPTIEAAVTVRVRAQGGQCLPANQILLVSWVSATLAIITLIIFELLFTLQHTFFLKPYLPPCAPLPPCRRPLTSQW